MLTIDVEDNVYHTQEYEMDLHARFNPFSKLNLGRAFLHDVWNLRKQLLKFIKTRIGKLRYKLEVVNFNFSVLNSVKIKIKNTFGK